MRPTSMKLGLTAALVALVATGCATYDPYYDSRPARYSSYDNYDSSYRHERDRLRHVYLGEVVDVSEVRYNARRSGGGAVLGAVIGGVLGSQIGSGSGRTVATIGGALAGGAVGDRVERDGQRPRYALEVTVRLDNGDLVSVVQAQDPGFRRGDRVRVVGWGDSARVEFEPRY